MVSGLVCRQFEEIIAKYPKFIPPEVSKNGWIIKGLIDVIDDEGYCWDTYQVTIFVPIEYPNQLPQIFETGNKIEPIPDWHINSDKSCCLSTNAIMYSLFGGNVSLLRWLELFVMPFFANHIYKKGTGSYAQGEFSHGIPGIVEGYFKIFMIDKVDDVIKNIRLMTGISTMGRNEKCFCNSGKKYKNCYLKGIEYHLFNIPVAVLSDDLRTIELAKNH